VEYDHLPQWEPSYGGGAMMAPVFFCMIGVLVVACTAGLYLAMAAMQHYGLVPAALVAPFETSDDPCHGNGHSHMLADVPTRPSGARCMQLAERKGLLSWSDTANFECDSAMGSSDNGSPQARSQGATHFVDNPPYTRTRDLDV